MSFPNPDNYARDCACTPDNASPAPTSIESRLTVLESLGGGPAGPIGPTGPTGAASTVPGPQGPTGFPGATGPSGNLDGVFRTYYISNAIENFGLNLEYFPPYFPSSGQPVLSQTLNPDDATAVIAGTPSTTTFQNRHLWGYTFDPLYSAGSSGHFSLEPPNFMYAGSPSVVSVRTEGWYRFAFQYFGFDLKDSIRVTVKLWRFNGANNNPLAGGPDSSWLVVAKRRFNFGIGLPEDDGDSFEGSIVIPVRRSSVFNLGVTPKYAFSYLFQGGSNPSGPASFPGYSTSARIPTFSMWAEKIREA